MAKRSEGDGPQQTPSGRRWPAHVVGLVWMSHLTTVMVEMVTPAIIGNFFDRRFHTSFLTLGGLALGVPLGIFHIYWLLKTEGWLAPPPKRSGRGPASGAGEGSKRGEGPVGGPPEKRGESPEP